MPTFDKNPINLCLIKWISSRTREPRLFPAGTGLGGPGGHQGKDEDPGAGEEKLTTSLVDEWLIIQEQVNRG